MSSLVLLSQLWRRARARRQSRERYDVLVRAERIDWFVWSHGLDYDSASRERAELEAEHDWIVRVVRSIT